MSATLPAVSLDLDEFLRPSDFATEWVYGPARNDWLRTHPITAYADAEDGEPTVELSGPLGLGRDEIPHLIAWLTAVYAATGTDNCVPRTSMEWGVGDPDDCSDDDTVQEIGGPDGMSSRDRHYGRALLCRDVARGPWRRADVTHGPGQCACGGHLSVSSHRHGLASCVAGGGR